MRDNITILPVRTVLPVTAEDTKYKIWHRRPRKPNKQYAFYKKCKIGNSVNNPFNILFK